MSKITQIEDSTEVFIAQLAGRMRNARRITDVTQAKAAELCGISERLFRQYEMGSKAPAIDVLMKLCVHFNQEPDFLIFGRRPNQEALLGADAAAELAQAVQTVFGAPDVDPERIAKLARYAFENAQAKGTAFLDELKLVDELMK